MRDPHNERYRVLLEAHSFVRWLAPVVRWGLILVGLSLFGLEASQLLGTTLGFYERFYHGAFGLVALLGFGLLGTVLGWMLRAGADLVEVLIDVEVASEKTADLTEQHVVPTLNRMARSMEQLVQSVRGTAPARDDPRPPAGTPGRSTRREP